MFTLCPRKRFVCKQVGYLGHYNFNCLVALAVVAFELYGDVVSYTDISSTCHTDKFYTLSWLPSLCTITHIYVCDLIIY